MFNRFVRPFCVSVVVLLQACGSSTTGNSSSSGGAPSAGSGGSGHGAGASNGGSSGTNHGAGASSGGGSGVGQIAGANNGGDTNTAGTSNGGDANAAGDTNAAGAGDVDAGPPPCPDGEARLNGSTECTPVKRLFVTKRTFTGNLVSRVTNAQTGLDAADALCNSSAQAAGLSGQYRAWLSTSTVNAIDRITDVGPWYVLNEYFAPYFANKAAIIVPHPGQGLGIQTTEDGSVLNINGDGGVFVWTGTAPDGTNHNPQGAKANQFCKDWTSALSTDNGTYGFANEGPESPTWTQFPTGYSTCDSPVHLYCFEQ